MLYAKFLKQKHFLVKHFAFLKNVCYINIYILCLEERLFVCFVVVVVVYELLIGHNQLSRNVLLFSCNPIGQLCVSGPRYRIHTVYAYMKHWRRQCDSWVWDNRLLHKCIFRCDASPTQENQEGGLYLVHFLSPWESCCSSATWLLLVGPSL